MTAVTSNTPSTLVGNVTLEPVLGTPFTLVAASSLEGLSDYLTRVGCGKPLPRTSSEDSDRFPPTDDDNDAQVIAVAKQQFQSIPSIHEKWCQSDKKC